jgi:GTP cyclohydrolase I
MEKHYQKILESIETPPLREALAQTPARAAEAMRFFTKGYHVDIHKIFENALFETSQEDLIVIKNIEYYSLCEHHLLPFFGRCHIGYIPNGKLVGLSKFAEIVDVFARRLQVQETLCEQIAACLDQHIAPHGLAVVIEGQHLCMMMRGIQKQQASFTTQKMLGRLTELEQQQLFFNLLQTPG